MTALVIGLSVTLSVFVLTIVFLSYVLLLAFRNGESNERTVRASRNCKQKSS